MNKYILVAGIACMSATFSFGRELGANARHDGRIEFSIHAPLAKHVAVKGSWGEAINMTKDADGIWSVVTDSLPSDDYWYTFSVDSITTVDPANPRVVRDITWLMSSVITPGMASDYFAPHNVKHGSVEHRWYHSDSLGMDRRLSVYLPPEYYTSDGRFPVLYLLHGSGGDENAWLELGHATQILDNMIARSECIPMIVVIPNGDVDLDAAPGFGVKSQDWSENEATRHSGLEFEDSFGEIMKFTDSNFRTIPSAKDRAVAGLSMGGGQAWNLASKYDFPAKYFGMFSAAFGWNGHGIDDDPFENLTTRSVGNKKLWIGIGKDDFLYQNNADARSALDSLGIKYQYLESDGGHSWSNWRKYLMQYLPTLFGKSN